MKYCTCQIQFVNFCRINHLENSKICDYVIWRLAVNNKLLLGHCHSPHGGNMGHAVWYRQNQISQYILQITLFTVYDMILCPYYRFVGCDHEAGWGAFTLTGMSLKDLNHEKRFLFLKSNCFCAVQRALLQILAKFLKLLNISGQIYIKWSIIHLEYFHFMEWFSYKKHGDMGLNISLSVNII